MSLIICKECGKSYSDKANSCPDCACPTEYNLELEDLPQNLTCMECGMDYDKSLLACPNCACPTEYNSSPVEDFAKLSVHPHSESAIEEPIERTQEKVETPSSPPITDVKYLDEQPNKISFLNLLFSTNGRASRKTYCLISIPAVLIAFACLKISQSTLIYETIEIPTLALAVISLLNILCVIIDICVTIRRLHDIDKSGYLAVLLIVPLISTILWIALMFIRGNDGENQFGEVSI